MIINFQLKDGITFILLMLEPVMSFLNLLSLTEQQQSLWVNSAVIQPSPTLDLRS